MNALRRLYATARRRPHTDLALAAALYGLTLVVTAADPSGDRLDTAGLVTAAMACGALAARRRWPFAVLLVSAVAAEGYLYHYHGHQRSLVLAAPLIALYTVAETSTRRRSLAIGVLAVLALAGVHLVIKPASWIGSDNLALAALGALAVAAGDATRSHRAYLAEAEARARQAEADRETEAARRVTEERLHIARELHDALGHQLALIHIQAEVAARVLDDPPTPARQALAHVRTASKAALGQLGDTVTLLRQPGEPTTPVQPITGLAGVDQLLSTFERSGLVIDVHADGCHRPVPAPTDLTAYRVLQESLTNVRKHAGPTTVAVRLNYRDDALRIAIDNTATRPTSGADPTSAGHSSGHGLLGMRERVTAIGGTLDAGPRPDGGYRVTASLPLPLPSRSQP
jgi:signal transduction histidine kinase